MNHGEQDNRDETGGGDPTEPLEPEPNFERGPVGTLIAGALARLSYANVAATLALVAPDARTALDAPRVRLAEDVESGVPTCSGPLTACPRPERHHRAR